MLVMKQKTPVTLIVKNQSTTVKQIPSTPIKLEKSKNKAKKPIDEETAIEQKIVDSIHIKSTHKSSYFQLYEDYELALFCKKASEYDYNLLQINKKNVNPKEHLKLSIPTEKQTEAWEILFNDCEQLALDYPKSYDVVQNIIDLLKSTTTQSKAETSLKQALNQVDEYQELINKTLKLLDGSSHPEIVFFRREVRKIEYEMEKIINQTALENEYLNLQKQLQRAQTQLKNEEKARTTTAEETLSIFLETNDQLQKKLITSHSHEYRLIYDTLRDDAASRFVYEELNHALNVEKNSDDFPILKNLIYKQKLIKDKEYFEILIGPALDLLACYKGIDCSQSSHRSISFCLEIERAHNYPQACEMDLQSFYFDVFLSKNQLTDVLTLFNYLTQAYEN